MHEWRYYLLVSSVVIKLSTTKMKATNDDEGAAKAGAAADGSPTDPGIIAATNDDADLAAGNTKVVRDDDTTTSKARTPTTAARANPESNRSSQHPSFAAAARARPRPSLRRDGSSLGRSVRHLRGQFRQQSSRVLRGLNQNLPATPSGWALATLSAASLGLQYERSVQKELTAPRKHLVRCVHFSVQVEAVFSSTKSNLF